MKLEAQQRLYSLGDTEDALSTLNSAKGPHSQQHQDQYRRDSASNDRSILIGRNVRSEPLRNWIIVFPIGVKVLRSMYTLPNCVLYIAHQIESRT